MLSLLGYLLKNGVVTSNDYCPDLSDDLIGLPKVTAEPCLGTSCNACAETCPTGAISVNQKNENVDISLVIIIRFGYVLPLHKYRCNLNF